MPSQRLHPIIPVTFLALAALTACGSSSASPANPASPGAIDLTPEIVEACDEVFARQSAGSGAQLVVVLDTTGSNNPVLLPTDLLTAITEVSLDDGSLTLISIEGEGAAPQILANRVALSTEGDRSRPSVQSFAAVMPSCVQARFLSAALPTTAGTDLYSGLALASEFLTDDSQLWVISDLLSTTGPYTMSTQLLSLEPAEAVTTLVSAAPIDLRGTPAHFLGIGQTSQPLRTADRSWLLEFGRHLCAELNAAGCDSITIHPVEPTPRDPNLPDDPLPVFGSLEVTSAPEGCQFTLPASVTFAADSATLREGAAEILAKPISLATSNAEVTVTITGHTASVPHIGDAELVAFSAQRAQAVASLFTAAGVAEGNITTRGMGDAMPLAEDIDPHTGHQIPLVAAAERRVEIILTNVSCG